MSGQQINRVSTVGLNVLSLTALVTVCVGVMTRVVLVEHPLPPEPDEGTLAHIFQLSVGLMLPAGLVFLATVDWTEPLRGLRRLAFPAAAVVLAFALLYYMEH